jgi:hypothetical protein
MRRLFTLLAALGLATTLLGCCHMSGICDCDRNNDPCNYYAPWDHRSALPEPIAATPTTQSGSAMQKVIEK